MRFSSQAWHTYLAADPSHGTETRRGSKRTEAGEGGEDAGKKSATDDDDDGEDGDEDENDDAIDEGMVVEEAEEEGKIKLCGIGG